MKTNDKSMQVQTSRLSEGMSLIFDQEAPSSPSSPGSRSSSRSSGRSRSSSRDCRSSRSTRRSHRRRDRSRSTSGTSTSSTQSRSRSHPRCHRQSSRHRCHHRCHSPPRRFRAHSRSYSPSPDRSHRQGRLGSPVYRSYRAHSRSSSSERYHRRRSHSHSRSPGHRRHRGPVSQYRNRHTDSAHRSPRSYRSRSRTPERSSVHLSQDEKRELLKIATENAVKTVGADRLALPEDVKSTLLTEEKAALSPDHDARLENKRVRQEREPQQSSSQVTTTASEDGELSPKMSPKRKLITFSINNTVAKPTNGRPNGMAEIKVTPRVDIVGSKKPYGQWIPVKTAVSLSSK